MIGELDPEVHQRLIKYAREHLEDVLDDEDVRGEATVIILTAKANEDPELNRRVRAWALKEGLLPDGSEAAS